MRANLDQSYASEMRDFKCDERYSRERQGSELKSLVSSIYGRDRAQVLFVRIVDFPQITDACLNLYDVGDLCLKQLFGAHMSSTDMEA